MQFSKIISIIILIIFVSSTIIISKIFYDQQNQEYLKVVFLDVGQGDAIFIEAPNGYQVLIDGGPNSDVVRSLSKFIPYYDRTVDLLIATHSDADHISGFVDLMNRFSVSFYGKNYFNDTDSLNTEILKLIDSNNIDQVFLSTGDKIIIDKKENIYLEILWPPKEYYVDENNDNSVIVRLVYNQTTFLFTGDASLDIEKILVQHSSENLGSTVLKAGHHGSKTSTDTDFLKATDPDYVIISAGKDNKFGHPHQEVIDRLELQKIKILETSVLGSIYFQSDGGEVRLMN